jgi:hypothetical protein
MGDRTDEALARLPAVHRAIEAIPLPGADHDKVLGAYFRLQNAIRAFGADEVAEGKAVVSVDGLPTPTTITKEGP